jgi:NhaA family Na+:H+ antiporter
MRYVYRHLPLADRDHAMPAAELAEYAAESTRDFWAAHDLLMRRGPVFGEHGLEQIARSSACRPATRATRPPRRSPRAGCGTTRRAGCGAARA